MKGIKIACQTCGGTILTSDISGEYCSKCGLIFSSVQSTKQPKTPQIIKKRVCRICKEEGSTQEHHIIPKRKKVPTKTIRLCRKCHKIADIIANVIYPKEVEVR